MLRRLQPFTRSILACRKKHSLPLIFHFGNARVAQQIGRQFSESVYSSQQGNFQKQHSPIHSETSLQFNEMNQIEYDPLLYMDVEGNLNFENFLERYVSGQGEFIKAQSAACQPEKIGKIERTTPSIRERPNVL